MFFGKENSEWLSETSMMLSSRCISGKKLNKLKVMLLLGYVDSVYFLMVHLDQWSTFTSWIIDDLPSVIFMNRSAWLIYRFKLMTPLARPAGTDTKNRHMYWSSSLFHSFLSVISISTDSFCQEKKTSVPMATSVLFGIKRAAPHHSLLMWLTIHSSPQVSSSSIDAQWCLC